MTVASRRRPQVASRFSRVCLLFSLTAAVFWTVPPSRVHAVDLHAFWDRRCASCHRHAGEFARNHLKVKDGQLVGRKPDRNLCAFLVEHGAGPDLADDVCKMLTAQAATRSLFKDRCATCHDTAAELARTGLVPGDGGALKGKESGRDLAEFLITHGKFDPGELAIVADTLRRVFLEVHDAGK